VLSFFLKLTKTLKKVFLDIVNCNNFFLVI
jgi:hypothetical protein